MSTEIAVQPSSSKSFVDFPRNGNVFKDLESLTESIARRAFGIFQQRGGKDGRPWDDWLQAETELLKPMPIELSESNDSYMLRAEVPGFAAKDLKVSVETNAICIHGKNEQKQEEKNGKRVTYSEVSAKEICRCIDLPSAVNADKANARLNNGILELILPKASPPKSVEIKVA